jgi:predicted dehydrogenase
MSEKKRRRDRTDKVSRRHFLGTAATAVALPYFIPPSALGKAGTTAPGNRITLGVIGYGSRGGLHTRTFLGQQDIQILAVCDPYKSKRDKAKGLVEGRYAKQKAAGAYKGCAAYADFRDIIVRDDIDAVVVASPEFWHGLHMAMAAKSGKDVYGEKALTLTIDQGRKLVDTVRRYGRVFQAGIQQRSGRNFRYACELARNGYIGKLKKVEVGVPGGRSLPNAAPCDPPPDIDYEMWLGPAPYTPYNKLKCSFNWYFIMDYCVGWIQSWGVHHCDIALWGAPSLVDSTLKVSGTARFPTDGLADTSISWNTKFVTPEGLEFSFTNNKVNPQGCRFIGDKGWVHVSRRGIQAEPKSLLSIKIKPEDEHLYNSVNHHRNFIDCIKTRGETAAPVEACHAATTVSIVADIATRVGRELTWDWKTETFLNDDQANRMLRRPMRSPWYL